MLVLEHVKKNFGKKTVLQPTSFTLNKGITGLLGPNGAGKTTLLRILATYYRPTEGNLILDGVSWNQKNLETIRNKIGYLPQHPGMFPALNVMEYLEYIGILRGMNPKRLRTRISEVLREVNLEEKAYHKIRSLSGGMKQRAGIAQAIIHEPALLLVDEPTAGLDPEERIRFRHLIKRLARDRIVMISTHITEDVAVTCDQVFLMKNGNIAVHEEIESVVSYAQNQTWRLQVSYSEYEQIKKKSDIMITNMKEQGNQYELRVLSDHPPGDHAQPVVPNLEEGYMVWLNRN